MQNRTKYVHQKGTNQTVVFRLSDLSSSACLETDPKLASWAEMSFFGFQASTDTLSSTQCRKNIFRKIISTFFGLTRINPKSSLCGMWCLMMLRALFFLQASVRQQRILLEKRESHVFWCSCDFRFSGTSYQFWLRLLGEARVAKENVGVCGVTLLLWDKNPPLRKQQCHWNKLFRGGRWGIRSGVRRSHSKQLVAVLWFPWQFCGNKNTLFCLWKNVMVQHRGAEVRSPLRYSKEVPCWAKNSLFHIAF